MQLLTLFLIYYWSKYSTYIGVVSVVCASCTSSCSCSCCTSFSPLHNSYSSWRFYSTSCNFLSSSSNIFFSLFIYATLLSRCHLFASISKSILSTSGSSLGFYLFSVCVLSIVFLLPLSCTGLLLIVAVVVAPYGVSTLSVASHSTTMLIDSFRLEEL